MANWSVTADGIGVGFRPAKPEEGHAEVMKQNRGKTKNRKNEDRIMVPAPARIGKWRVTSEKRGFLVP